MLSISGLLCSLLMFASFTSIQQKVSALNPISVDGVRLIDGVTGDRFFAHGSGFDYAVDDDSEHFWRPALDLLLSTVPNINALRLYEVDPLKSYQKFIDYVNAKNVYIVIPLTPSGDNPNWGFCAMAADSSPDFPKKTTDTTCYPSCLLEYGQRIMGIFSQTPATLSYMVGNEIIDKESRWAAAPCIKVS